MDSRRVALITGASGEIGSAIALTLANNGFDVILHHLKNKDKIIEVEKKCLKSGVRTWLVQANLANIDEINSMYEQIKRLNLVPTILINNAGISHYGLIQDVSFSEWQAIINTNMMSSFFCSQKAISGMLQSGYGRIINISSIWGSKGAANEVVYSMSKGAINAFTKALARELAPSGITVNAIAPGIVISKMMESFSEEEINDLKTEIPMGRFAEPKEIANSILYLIHPNSSYVTGQIIGIDGGWE